MEISFGCWYSGIMAGYGLTWIPCLRGTYTHQYICPFQWCPHAVIHPAFARPSTSWPPHLLQDHLQRTGAYSRHLITSSVPLLKILPFCFSDGQSCRLDNRLPDPFKLDNKKGLWTFGLGLEEGGGLDQALGKVFGVHLHNQWERRMGREVVVEEIQ